MQHNDEIYICGVQPSNVAFGKVGALFKFDYVEYGSSKNIVAATVATAPKTIESLQLDMLLCGEAANYELCLQNICLQKNLQASQRLNVVGYVLYIFLFVLVFFCLFFFFLFYYRSKNTLKWIDFAGVLFNFLFVFFFLYRSKNSLEWIDFASVLFDFLFVLFFVLFV